LPPDFTTPANASKPRMNDTGPDAVPPPASRSRDERICERFEPVPEPPLNSIASVFARSMIDSMVSSTELMKQALACCGVSFTPRLNQTGLLNAMRCVTSTWVSSSANACESVGRREVARRIAPLADLPDHAADQLLDAALAVGGVEVAAEVLRHHDVGSELRPALRDLDVLLLEDDSPPSPVIFALRSSQATASNGSVAGLGEDALDREALGRRPRDGSARRRLQVAPIARRRNACWT
jgi:hypothetical protein